MSKLKVVTVGVLIGILAAIFCLVMVSHTPISKATGGHGRVVSGGVPIAGANVTISDLAGTLSAQTDFDGKFDIKVDSRRNFYLSMSNPLKHHVAVRIEKDGSLLAQWKFEKRVLGENYFDFGTIDIAPR